MCFSILVVDDELVIRSLLSSLLASRGYTVSTASSVELALREIVFNHFDLLISDLSIDQISDGLTIVSAMRCIQPSCATIIYTETPAFQQALENIENQVDQYHIKADNIDRMLETVDSLRLRPQHKVQITSQKTRISELLRKNIFQLVQQTLSLMKTHQELKMLVLSDEERIAPFPALLNELANMLDQHPFQPTNTEPMQAAEERGRIRHKQGYSLPLLVTSIRFLENSIYDMLHKHIQELDLQFLMPDIAQLSNCLALQLEQAIRSFLKVDRLG